MIETPGKEKKTHGNGPVTLEEIKAEIQTIRADYRHTDEYLHRIDQVVAGLAAVLEEYKPLLARAKVLTDPGAGVRRFMGKTKG